MKKLNIVGHKYNMLTVLEEVILPGGKSTWKCQCDCGTIKNIKLCKLRSGSTKSCGCWNKFQNTLKSKKMNSKRIKYSPIETSARRVWKKRYNEMLFDDFFNMSQQNCYYCGESPSNIQNCADKRSSENMKKNGYFIYNGLDRLDNLKEHTKENCVPCCKYCNYAKRERTVEEFKAWIIKTYNFFIKQ